MGQKKEEEEEGWKNWGHFLGRQRSEKGGGEKALPLPPFSHTPREKKTLEEGSKRGKGGREGE